MKKQDIFNRINSTISYIYIPIIFSVAAIIIVAGIQYGNLRELKSFANSLENISEPQVNTSYSDAFTEKPSETEPEGETVDRSKVEIADYGVMYATISCEKIGLNAPVFKGDDDSLLNSGIGQNFASSQPGFGRLILLCGHNNSYFNALKNIDKKDIVLMTTDYGVYKYEVTDMRVLEENDESAYDFNAKEEQLVMYTCYPFETLSRTQYRYFVYATLIEGPKFVDN